MKHKHKLGCAGAAVIIVCLAVMVTITVMKLIDIGAFGRMKTEISLLTDPIDKNAVSSKDDDWQLILINADNPLPDNFSVTLTPLANGHKIDSRVYPHLQQMFDDARKQGIFPTISSSYRTAKEQQSELDQKKEEFIRQGYAPDDALEAAKTWAALPGTSEHQAGLAVDITSADASVQSPDIVWNWLKTNAHKYGFIRRYPPDKVSITGISNEPWHFRYVGQAAAEEIYKHGLCLEEYLEILHREN